LLIKIGKRGTPLAIFPKSLDPPPPGPGILAKTWIFNPFVSMEAVDPTSILRLCLFINFCFIELDDLFV
jgi:hypothetical protein